MPLLCIRTVKPARAVKPARLIQQQFNLQPALPALGEVIEL